MRVVGKSWDTSVYDGILQFHDSKGFDPYSQQVAIQLGWPLVQVSCDRETLLMHNSDTASYTKGGSKDEVDEQYDAGSSELRETFPIQNAQIDSYNTRKDYPTPEDMPTANDGHTEIPENLVRNLNNEYILRSL
ncbi:hypothetical protein B0H13DRAFT_2351482 [Mycena leptocephala]|nr:hypothetical protein B0H13DRAFT_2351482 [Mycena leptocephala]